jgi:transcriptional regulator with XRE-family HTH domain
MDNQFGITLKKARQSVGVSQDKLAEMLLISKSLISRWENGKVYPQVRWIYEIAEKLGVNPEDLI